MLASSVLSDSELLLLSSLGERVGNETWIKPQEQGLHPSNIYIPVRSALGHRSFQRSSTCSLYTSLGGSWGRFLLISQHFTPSLWKLGLGKQSQPFPHATTHGSLENSWTSHSVSQPV